MGLAFEIGEQQIDAGSVILQSRRKFLCVPGHMGFFAELLLFLRPSADENFERAGA